ncbi:Protein OS-9 [Steccherinum ochraceum]|uniref:Protein OS-9 homolog n=1 Tax=Steccherinum ochraceum TaxID=92696 RepID=A0A4V2MV46_9APHY|nr:Protein OS-9 [Steccherinum ochraceum]
MLAFALIPASLVALVTARLHHSRVPDDPYAFPKYRVSFLNGLPILNDTVQRWMQDGLRGGEAEFLDQPWEYDLYHSSPLKSIEGTQGQQEVLAPPKSSPNHTLELMKFGRNEYLCLIPPPPEEPAPTPPEESTGDEVRPGHTWSLLQPLSGTCLYHRHGWFTYSYCHNSHVRQFREMVQPPDRRAGDWKPEEDPEWEAYTLGRAPPTLEPGADLTVAEEAALAANVELARGPGSRYLVQRWGDGTTCDKTGRKRDIEVQFHCSMTTPDSIIFIKETQTCHYVLHIATPRLCGEPGFKNRLDAHEESPIRCREVLSTVEAYEAADRSLPAADHPYKLPSKRPRVKPPVIAPPPPKDKDGAGGEKAAGGEKQQKPLTQVLSAKPELLKKALEKLMAETGELKSGAAVVMEEGEDGDEFVVEFLVDDDDEDMQLAVQAFAQAAGDNNEGSDEQDSSKKEDKAKTLPELIEMLREQHLVLQNLKEKLGPPPELHDEKQQKDAKTKAKKGPPAPPDQWNVRRYRP